MRWRAPDDDDVAGYVVYRARNDFSVTAGAQRLNPGALVSATSYRDATTETGTRYHYRIAAMDGAENESALSGLATVTPLPDPPDAP